MVLYNMYHGVYIPSSKFLAPIVTDTVTVKAMACLSETKDLRVLG